MDTQVVTFHYTLKDKEGRIIDSSKDRGPMAVFRGAGHIIPGLEKHMQSMKAGDSGNFVIPASEGYGERVDELMVTAKKSELPPQVKVGDRFRGGEEPNSPIFAVTAITGEEVFLDGNHPLAGVELHFDIQVVEVRPATTEEIAHGHAHDGHSHH